MAAPKQRSLIHHADFRRLWAGDALGQLGAQLSTVALPILAVQHLHATAWQMGVLTAAQSAAFLVIGLPAGAWVDRMRKRTVLISADLVRAAILTLVVIAAATDHATMPLLYIAGTALSVATVFFDVAHQSYVPGLVGHDNIVEGNSKLQATQSVAMVVGPSVAGWLLRIVSVASVVGGNVVTYLASAAAVSTIRQRESLPDPATRRPLTTEIREGLSFVVRQPLLRRIVACTGIGNFFHAAAGAVTVIFALRQLGLSTGAYGTVLSASAIGGVVGAVLAGWLTRRIGEGRIVPISALLIVPGAAITPLAAALPLPPTVVLVAGGVLFTIAAVIFNVAVVSYRQRLCPPELLGRMNASVRFLVWGTVPLGALTGGWLGGWIGAEATLWVAAVGAGLGALPVLFSPLIRMRDMDTADVA